METSTIVKEELNEDFSAENIDKAYKQQGFNVGRSFSLKEETDDKNQVRIELVLLNEFKINDNKDRTCICLLCSLTFDTLQTHSEHVIEEHEEISINQCKSKKCRVLLTIVEDCKYICTYCCKGFKSRRYLNRHIKHHLNKREYECKICLKQFNVYAGLYMHTMLVHTDKEDWKHVCIYCSKHFPTKPKLLRHSLIHSDVKPYNCRLCDKKFHDESSCRRHIQTHSTTYLYKCAQCDKNYKDKTSLKIHMVKIHKIGDLCTKPNVENYKYVCTYCYKGFKNRFYLNRHLKIHLNKREYECKVCSKQFNTDPSLRTHMTTVHMDRTNWKYICMHCNKQFPTNSKLTRHVQIHSDDKPFKCPLCKKGFRDESSCRKHLRTHSDECFYNCAECEKSYKDKRSLVAHMAKIHRFGGPNGT